MADANAETGYELLECKGHRMMRGRLLMALAASAVCQSKMGVARDVAPESQALVVADQASGLASSAAPVQTLQQALARTYETNPILLAQRAELRRLDSGVALQRAAGRPQIAANADYNQEISVTRKLGTRGRSLSVSTNVQQVLFASGRIRNSVRAAETRVIAGRADLRATEADVLTEAVSVYADLLRDREVQVYALGQIRALATNLDSARARFRVGDLTRTDVSQSEARLALARSNLATAEGRLQSSEENFQRVVGARAGVLEPLPPLPPMPLTAEQAVESALVDNPDVASIVAQARAAGYDVSATKAERLPTISAVGFASYDDALGTADRAAGVPKGTVLDRVTTVEAGFSIRLPLYQGGAASARVRQAEETRAQVWERAIAAERLTVANARAAFATWRSALIAITANEAAASANEMALQSIKVEQTVGSRSILDVLNAEQELLQSRIDLADARRDAYVAAFTLLNAMGAAEAADLNLETGPQYDPRANYKEYAGTWSDWADGPRRAATSTRTVPEQVDSPVTRLKTGTPNKFEKRP
jgi:outer membrane protein